MLNSRKARLKRAGAILASSGLTFVAVYFLITRAFELPEQASAVFLLFCFALIATVILAAAWRGPGPADASVQLSLGAVLFWAFTGLAAWAAVWQLIQGSLFTGAALATVAAVLSRIALSRLRRNPSSRQRAA